MSRIEINQQPGDLTMSENPTKKDMIFPDRPEDWVPSGPHASQITNHIATTTPRHPAILTEAYKQTFRDFAATVVNSAEEYRRWYEIKVVVGLSEILKNPIKAFLVTIVIGHLALPMFTKRNHERIAQYIQSELWHTLYGVFLLIGEGDIPDFHDYYIPASINVVQIPGVVHDGICPPAATLLRISPIDDTNTQTHAQSRSVTPN